MLTGFSVPLESHCPIWAGMWCQGSPFPAARGCQEPGPSGGELCSPALLLILLLATGRLGT